MPKISMVTCPACQQKFPVNRSDFIEWEGDCRCPFCAQEFPPEKGKPYPPLHAGGEE